MSHETETVIGKATASRFGGHDIRCLPLFLMLVMAALSSACAEIGACPPGQRLVDGRCTPPPPACKPEGVTKPIAVACLIDPLVEGGTGEPSAYDWELTVKPVDPIDASRPFRVQLSGLLRVESATINAALGLLPGFRRVALMDLEAKVEVRKGAQPEGDDVVLKASPIDKTCTYDENGNKGPDAGPFSSCLDDDDCTGLGGAPDPDNLCLSFITIQTSDDCTPDGKCFELGWTGSGSSCANNGFCATGDVTFELEPNSPVYIADRSGTVLFGWAERGVEELTEGPNRGAYDLESMRRGFGEEIAISGLDVVIDTAFARSSVVEFAFECVMGVLSRGPDGVPTVDGLFSPSPDGVLISCPIQEPE